MGKLHHMNLVLRSYGISLSIWGLECKPRREGKQYLVRLLPMLVGGI